MNRVNFVPAKNAVLCSEHFHESCFKQMTKNIILKRDAIPSLFDHTRTQDLSLKYAKCSQVSNFKNKSEECEVQASKPNNTESNLYQREFVSYVTTQSEMDSQQSESTSDDINDHISSSESIVCDNGINFSQDTELDFSSGEEIQTLKQPEPRILENINIEHSYSSKKSPHENCFQLKKQITSLRAKLKKSQRKAKRLGKSVKSLKGLIKILKQKNLISNSCEDVLQDSFSGIFGKLMNAY